MSLFRRAMDLVSAPEGVTIKMPTLRGIDERNRLREAIAALPAVEAALQAKTQALNQARDFISAADEASYVAEMAGAAVNAANQAWVERGAPSGMPVDAKLKAALRHANLDVAEAAGLANAAIAALPRLREDVSNARLVRDQAQHRIKQAVSNVLLAEIEPQFAILARVSAEYNQALATVESLRELVNPRLGSLHPWHALATGNADVISRRLNESAVLIPQAIDLRERSQAWAEFAKRLAIDPDASL